MRCFCKDWIEETEQAYERLEDGRTSDVWFSVSWDADSDAVKDFRYCPWCRRPLGESKSQQNRLEIQLKEKKDA